MVAGRRSRGRRAVVALIALTAVVTLATLATGCSGSSSTSSDRQASGSSGNDLLKNLQNRLCVGFRSSPPSDVQFDHDYPSAWYSVPATTADGVTNFCDVQWDPLDARFTTPGGVGVTVRVWNNVSYTVISVTHDGKTEEHKEVTFRTPQASYRTELSSGESITYGYLPDTASKEFVVVTAPE